MHEEHAISDTYRNPLDQPYYPNGKPVVHVNWTPDAQPDYLLAREFANEPSGFEYHDLSRIAQSVRELLAFYDAHSNSQRARFNAYLDASADCDVDPADQAHAHAEILREAFYGRLGQRRPIPEPDGAGARHTERPR